MGTLAGGFPHCPRAGKRWPVTHTAVLWGLKEHFWVNPDPCLSVLRAKQMLMCFYQGRLEDAALFWREQPKLSYIPELQVISRKEMFVRMCSADEPRASHSVLITASSQAKPQESKNKPKTSSRRPCFKTFPLHFSPHGFANTE